LFGNPNDTGVAALYCIVLVAYYPEKSRLLTAIQALIALTALALTFSKAGTLCLGALMILILIERRSLKLVLAAIVVVAIAGICLQYLFDHDLFSLNREQRGRIADVLDLAGGEVSNRATTGRTILWETGLWRIEDQLPWGSGLGSFHSLEGGSRGSVEKWLGVHNTFLMVLGEGGLFPFAIFLAFLARTFIAGALAKERMVAVGFFVVLLVDMGSSHSSFGFRLSNVAVAVMLAIGARAAIERSRNANWRAARLRGSLRASREPIGSPS
jgi:O-antigen ligase